MRSLPMAILFAIVCSIGTTRATNPGVKLRLTQKGVDHVNVWAQEAVRRELTRLRIPDQNEGGRLQWWLTNIQTRWVNIPTSQISLDPVHNGLSWTLNNLGISLRANWRVRYKRGWFRISSSGNVDMTARGVNADIRLRLGTGSDGRPTLTTAQCSDHVSDVSVRFHGSLSSRIINMFRGKIGRRIRDKVRGKICEAIRKVVRVDTREELQRVRVSTNVADDFRLDYSLTSPPIVTNRYLETLHKGVVYMRDRRTEPPMLPPPIPDTTATDKMVYIWLTDFTANTLGYAAFTNDILVWNLTAQQLPANKRSALSTTCDEEEMCIGAILTEVADAYPNTVASLGFRATEAPTVDITSGAFTLSSQGNLDVFVTGADNTSYSLVTLSLGLSLTAQAELQNNRLTFRVSDYTFNIDVVQSSPTVGDVNAFSLNFLGGFAMEYHVIPKLNERGLRGIALPIADDMAFTNSALEFVPGAVLIATDLV